MEQAKSISTIRMGDIVCELSQWAVLRANVWVIWGSSWVNFGVEPIPVVIWTSCMIVDEDVVWVSDPETSGGLVRVQETPRLLGKDCQVTIKVVLCLNCIFNEEGMAHCVISYVMNDSQEADSMNSACSVERLMNCVSLDVGFSDCTD